jgi:serine/threonine protein kinase
MPVPTTTQDMLELVRKSELIPQPRLDTFASQVAAAGSARTPRDLANLLVAAGLVTHFQAEQFLQGKWRGFTIGKYKVLERIGSGGMGTVYLCEHLSVGRKVAVKVLPTSQSDNPSALGRFYREARAAGVLDHPNLVKAHDVDQEGGLHYLVMDYVDGTSLQDIVSRFGPLSVTRACHCVRLSAQGLQAAHQAGLVHRDVKPANILQERNGNVRLLDLGLARFYNDNIDPLTLKYDNCNVLGTADYVAPEQAVNSHEADIRADIYSLGATFYFLLTGRPPFPEGKVPQKLIWHQVRQPKPIRELRRDVPDGVIAVIERMMAKNPAQRYQAPIEVVEALAPFTVEPVAAPREEEMPRLSLAATSAGPPMTTPPCLPPPRRVGQNGRSRMAPSGAVPSAVAQESNVRVATLGKPPLPDEVPTPRGMAVQTPTQAAKPRPVRARAPSRLPAPDVGDRTAGPSSGGARSLLWALAVVALSALVGVGLNWWLGGR